MRHSMLVLVAILTVISLGLWGCSRRPPATDPDEEVEAGDEEGTSESEDKAEDKAAEEPPEEPAPAEDAKTEEKEPEPEMTPEREARQLFQTGSNLYNEARESWKKFRDGGKNLADWERTSDLLVQAQERCDQAMDKDSTFERVHNLSQQIISLRRMLMDTKPE